MISAAIPRSVMTVSADAAGPVPSHLAHIDATDTLSLPSRLGVVDSVTVTSQPRSRSILPAHPYARAGRNSPAVTITTATAAGCHPWLASSHGSRISAYGLTNAATPTSAPAASGRSI